MKLASLKPQLTTLQPSIGYPADGGVGEWQRRIQAEPCMALYYTKRWKRLRWAVLVRDLFTCQMCRRIVADTSQLVCDHIEPHRGNVVRFWAGPFQALCKPCHDRAKQREERGAGRESGPTNARSSKNVAQMAGGA